MRFHELFEQQEVRLPNPGETPFWVEALAPISKDLVDDDWGWTSGGCWAFAYALKAAIGGTLAGICEKDPDGDYWGTHHAMVLKNGVYYDYTGVVDVQGWLSSPGNHPGSPKKVMTARQDGFEAYQDEFLDEDQYKFLFKVLRQLRKKPMTESARYEVEEYHDPVSRTGPWFRVKDTKSGGTGPARHYRRTVERMVNALNAETITEAPIANYELIDKSSEEPIYPPSVLGGSEGPVAGNNSFRDDDLKALRSEKWRAKLVQTFRKTPLPINLYAYNAKYLKVHNQYADALVPNAPKESTPRINNLSQMKTWSGPYSEEDFVKTFGFLPPNHKDSLNFILLQNEGDDRMPLTPWMTAHRIVHSLLSDENMRRQTEHKSAGYFAFFMAQQMKARIESAWLAMHPVKTHKEELEGNTDAWAAATTLTSARKKRIASNRGGEIIIELFTQYFLTGDFTINLDWVTHPKTDIARIREYEADCKKNLEEMIHAAKGQLVVF